MENLKFPIYGDKIVAKVENEDKVDEIDYIELLSDPETIWLADDTDYNMIEASEVKAKVRGKTMMIYIIKLDDGNIIIEGKTKKTRRLN